MMNKIRVPDDWNKYIQNDLDDDFLSSLFNVIEQEYIHFNVYPQDNNIFKALEYTKLADVKVVIIGQDPYHNEGQANGLSFSVKPDVDIPKSLRNVFTELCDDIKCSFPQDGDLSHWASQGILLLNTVLTVRKNQPGSHRGLGWEQVTDKIIELVNSKVSPVVFLLWGKDALKKEKLITNKKHLVLKAPHPSPLSAYRGFFGCKHFSKTNEFLIKPNMTPIQWHK
jgi:uracil-DNA glycosylase